MVTLPWWANLALIVAASLLGGTVARRAQRRHPGLDVSSALKRVRHLWLVPVPIVLSFGAHCLINERPDLWWALPAWFEARYLICLWITLIGAMVYLYAFAATLAFDTRHPERKALIVAVALTLAAVQVMIVRSQRPIAPDLKHTVDADGVVLQTSGVSCVAASSANMLRRRGIEVTERQMAEALGTTAMGTTAGAAVEMFAARGIACRKTQGAATALSSPAMLMIDHPLAGPESHAVTYVGRAGERFEIWDPLEGRRLFDEAALTAHWSGRAIECAWETEAPTP